LGFPWSEFAAAHAKRFIFERRAVLHSSKKEERSPEKLMRVGLPRTSTNSGNLTLAGLNRFG
jgi:hypothetical protein